MNNLRLITSIVASLESLPVAQLDEATRFKDLDTDAFELGILVSANTRMPDEALRDRDLAVCATLGAFAKLMTEAGYTVTDEEIAVNAAADAADDNDIVLSHLIGA